MPKDITISGVASVRFTKVYRNVPDDEVEEIRAFDEDQVLINLDEDDLRAIQEIEHYQIKVKP